MATSDKLQQIIEGNEAIISSKGLIATSIEGKGVSVPEGTKLSEMPSLIDSIEQGGGGVSEFYLNKVTLSKDDGYIVENIPIKGGDVIQLGDLVDVEESTNWGTSYTKYSHPHMTQTSWASSIEIIDNTITIPTDLMTDITIGAIYKTTDNLNWYVYVDKTSGYTVSSDNLTSVSKGDYNQLSAVWIREGVRLIFGYEFQQCRTLTSINIPESVTVIEDYCFDACAIIDNITIPNSVTRIGNYCFRGCSLLTNITIPNSVTAIGNNCFRGCDSLANVNLPPRITALNEYLFYFCYSLKGIYIPNSVTTIGINCFYGCRLSLTNIRLSDNLNKIPANFLGACYSLVNITIPNSVTTIDSTAFSSCHSLANITIPNLVTSIGSSVFNNCHSLAAIVFLPTTPPTSSFAFTQTLLVPEGSIEAYQSATNYVDATILADTLENRIKFGIE